MMVPQVHSIKNNSTNFEKFLYSYFDLKNSVLLYNSFTLKRITYISFIKSTLAILEIKVIFNICDVLENPISH